MNVGEKIQLISTLSKLQSDRFFNKQDFCISELDKIENRMQLKLILALPIQDQLDKPFKKYF